jgi:hypothetical protein
MPARCVGMVGPMPDQLGPLVHLANSAGVCGTCMQGLWAWWDPYVRLCGWDVRCELPRPSDMWVVSVSDILKEHQIEM